MPEIFRQLLVFVKFASTPPCFLHSNNSTEQQQQLQKYPPSRTTGSNTGSGAYNFVVGNVSHHNAVSTAVGSLELVGINYIPFGEKAMNLCVKLYQNTATEEAVMKASILHEIIKVCNYYFHLILHMILFGLSKLFQSVQW